MVTGISMVQFPFRVALNVTTSDGPGTEAPPGPPEVVDQFAELFQLEAVLATQNRWALAAEIQPVSKIARAISLGKFIKLF